MLKRGRLFKDLTKIEDITDDYLDANGNQPLLQIVSDSSVTSSLHQEEENYNKSKKNKFAVRRNDLTEDSSGFNVVPATENELKGSVIRNDAGQLERMYINAETFAGGDSRFTSCYTTRHFHPMLEPVI